MALKEKRVGDAVVLFPIGYFMGGRETDALKNRLDELLVEGVRRFVVNLQETEHLNSTALGVLIGVWKQCEESGKKIVLCDLAPKLKNIFVRTKLAMVFEWYETEEQAIAATQIQEESDREM